ncbi:MAG: hypothetical protein ACKPKO_29295, partial [Candidatus Fonsibacter sp.]
MTMDVLGVTITKTLNLSQDLNITGATSCASDFYAPNIYNKSDINNLLSAKQNTLSCVDPINLDPPVAGFPLLIGSNIVPGLTVSGALTLTKNANNYLNIGLSTCICNKPTLTTSTITTYSAFFAIKSN